MSQPPTPSVVPIGESTWGYRLSRALTHAMLATWNRCRVEGREHLPEGAAVLVGNHQSFLDIPLVAAACRPRHVVFVARASLAKSRFMDIVMKRCRAILIERESSDRAAMREILANLEEGHLVCVFPEGTRGEDGLVGEFRGGALLAARRSGAPLVPMGLCGMHRILGREHRFPRPAQARARIGVPLGPDTPLEELRRTVAELAGAPLAPLAAPKA